MRDSASSRASMLSLTSRYSPVGTCSGSSVGASRSRNLRARRRRRRRGVPLRLSLAKGVRARRRRVQDVHGRPVRLLALAGEVPCILAGVCRWGSRDALADERHALRDRAPPTLLGHFHSALLGHDAGAERIQHRGSDAINSLCSSRTSRCTSALTLRSISFQLLRFADVEGAPFFYRKITADKGRSPHLLSWEFI